MAAHVWHYVGLSDGFSTADITSEGELRVTARLVDSGPLVIDLSSPLLTILAPIEPVTSLAAATTPGPGSALDAGQVVNGVTMHVSATGAPASFDVEIQVSTDNVNWFNTGAAITVSGTSALASAHGRYFRANLTALTGGTSPTVTAILATSR